MTADSNLDNRHTVASAGGGPGERDTQPAAAAPGTGRAANIALWVLQVVVALVFLGAAAGKITGDPQVAALFDEIGWGDWFRYVTAAVEIAGAIGLFIPRLAGLAALGLVGVMVGAVVTDVLLGHSVVPAVLFGVLAGVVAWGRRARTTELIRSLSSR